MSTSEMEKTINEVWKLFRETAARFKETEARFKETDARFKETDARFKETDARLDKRFKETDKKIKELANLFTGQWGKLIESLAESGIVEQLRSRGIMVTNLARRLVSHKNGHHIELDFLLTNENEAVIGEVKTTMRSEDVQSFIKKLREFLIFYPNYKSYRLYGAMIGIRMEQAADKHAYNNGLFVFQVGGKGMLKMLNDADFKPRDFNTASKTN